MEVVCEYADDTFCRSLEATGCCDYYEDGVAYVNKGRSVKRFIDEYDVVDGVVHSVGGSLCDSGLGKCELYSRILMREPVQLLHDLSIQICRLHRDGMTLTDVEFTDIACIDNRFCLHNASKVVKFDRRTSRGTLTFPPVFGPFAAPELSSVTQIPAVNAIHKTSAIWSIGMMFACYVFGMDGDDGDDGESPYSLLKSGRYTPSSIVPVICRCIHPDPDARMLIVV